jgi:DNA-binding transcriptional LysR family regulator
MGDAMMPALIAGTGLGILPEFFVRDALAAGQPDWSLPLGAVYWVTPPGGLRPKRVKVLGDFLAEKLSPRSTHGTMAAPASTPRGDRKRRGE